MVVQTTVYSRVNMTSESPVDVINEDEQSKDMPNGEDDDGRRRMGKKS